MVDIFVFEFGDMLVINNFCDEMSINIFFLLNQFKRKILLKGKIKVKKKVKL